MVNKGTELADFAFIFNKMKIKPFYILETVKHLKFIEFVKTNYNADIKRKKLTFRSTPNKVTLYNQILKDFIEKYPQINN